MSIEKINFYSSHFTPDSEKDTLESTHITEDEIMIVKNKKKIIEHERMKEIGENFEASDLLPNKEGVHIDQWPEAKNDRSMKKFESNKDIAQQRAIREARNKAINTKAS